jgi:hypothetical protein
MKKLLVVVLAMAVALSFGSMAMAKDGLSVDLGLAYNPNGADMGKTIMKDGEKGAENGLLGDVILSENKMLALKKSTYNQLGIAPITKVTDDGVMTGLNTALRVRYDFLNSFFARVGFVYDMQIGGGNDKFTLTSNNILLIGLVSKAGVANGSNVAWGQALVGQSVTQKWTYGSWAIPVTVGINVPINDGKYNIYAGIGLTYFSGYWQLEMNIPQGYVIADYNFDGTKDATDLGLAAAGKEKVKFDVSGIGINWTVGASAEVIKDLSIFLEIDATMAGAMSDNKKLSTNQAKAGLSSDNMVYPVNLSTQLIRLGVSYKLPIAL